MLTNAEFLIEQQEWSNYEIDSDKRRNGNEKRSNNKKGVVIQRRGQEP